MRKLNFIVIDLFLSSSLSRSIFLQGSLVVRTEFSISSTLSVMATTVAATKLTSLKATAGKLGYLEICQVRQWAPLQSAMPCFGMLRCAFATSTGIQLPSLSYLAVSLMNFSLSLSSSLDSTIISHAVVKAQAQATAVEHTT